MNFYRCLICGETYMGKDKPSNCPFCGAKGKHLVDAALWSDENTGISSLSERSRKNLERALQLEVNNAPFYREAMAGSRDAEIQGIFKYFSKIEAEHASVIRKILKREPPSPYPGKETANGDDKDNLMAALEREKTAAAFYKYAADEASEPRVRKVFNALSEIEKDHAALEKRLLKSRR